MKRMLWSAPLLISLCLAGCDDAGRYEIAGIESAISAETCGGVIDGDVLVTAAAELESLEDVSEITGTLTIQAGDLTAIDGLGCLQLIGGDLVVSRSESLSEISGFGALVEVGGSVRIKNNWSLQPISGFGSLVAIQGSLVIESLEDGAVASVSQFPRLHEVGGDLVVRNLAGPLHGLNELRSVAGSVRLADNEATEPGNALAELRSIGGNLAIEEMPLSSIGQLPNLRAIGGNLEIEDLSAPLEGLNQLRTVAGDVIIEDFGDVEPGSGLAELRSIGGDLRVTDGVPLSSISQFPNLREIGGGLLLEDVTDEVLMGFDQLRTVAGDFVLMEESGIAAIDGLGKLREIGGDLRIEGTGYLDELILDELETVGGGLFVLDFSTLATLSASRLASVGGDFVLDHSDLVTLSASSLASVGGDFVLSRARSLRSLDGLGQLTTVGGNYRVTGNDELPQQEALDLLDRLLANGFSGTSTVFRNGTGDGHE